MYRLICVLGVLILTLQNGCKQNHDKPAQDQAPEPERVQVRMTFEADYLYLEDNKNGLVAIRHANLIDPESLWIHSDSIDIRNLTISPKAYIGKVIRLVGRVYRITEAERDEYGDIWYSVMMSVKNRNSSLGTTNVDFYYKGPIDAIDNKDVIQVCGYFAGLYEGSNAYGGGLECYAVVGTKYKTIRKKRRN